MVRRKGSSSTHRLRVFGSSGTKDDSARGLEPSLMGWFIPTVAYVLVLGALGITTKLALRTLDWQHLLPWTLLAYAVTVAALLVMGQPGWSWQPGTSWAVASAALAVGALILLFLALGAGEASKVLPVSAAYPAVTLVLSALFLGEHISPARVAGVAFVILGVVLITTAR
jgi:transporter family protein